MLVHRCTVGLGEQVDGAERRRQRQHTRATDRASVRDERHVVRDASQPRVEVHQDRSEPIEVRDVGRIGDVEILRERDGAVDDRGDAADDYEVDLAFDESREQLAGAELRQLLHVRPSITSCRSSRMSRYHDSKRASRSSGVSRRVSCNSVSSTLDFRGTTSSTSARPMAFSARWSVATVTSSPAASSRATDGCVIPSLRASAAWVEALGLARLTDQSTGTHRSQTISGIAHESACEPAI